MVTNNMPLGKLDSFFPKSKTRRENSYEGETNKQLMKQTGHAYYSSVIAWDRKGPNNRKVEHEFY
jgi:hypothetical protein